MADAGIRRNGGRAEIVLGTKLTAADVPALQEGLKKELASGVREIVFDFSSVEIMDSTGIGLLVATNNSLAAAQGVVSLERVSPDLMKLLRSMRLADRLHASAAGRA